MQDKLSMDDIKSFTKVADLAGVDVLLQRQIVVDARREDQKLFPGMATNQQWVCSLEIARVDFAERHDRGNNLNYEGCATAGGSTKEKAKAMMLDNVLEFLNSEDLVVNHHYLRLRYYLNNELVETETF